MKYLLDEIIFFQESMIPLETYSIRVKVLRNKVNNYFNIKLLYLKQMLYKNEIDNEDYQNIKVIIEYEKNKFLNFIEQR